MDYTDEVLQPGEEHQAHDPELDAGLDAEHQAETRTPAPIMLGQRVFLCGMTGSGKSEALLHLFAVYGGQRLLIDVQDHYYFGPDALAEDPPPLEVDDPRAIDWRHRTIRYVPRRAGDRREMDRLHAAIFRRGRVFVAADELEDIAPSQGGGAPPFVRKCVKQGRKVRLTYGGATQRPVGVDRSIVNQAEHAFIFPMVDSDDLRIIAPRLGMTVHELHEALNRLGQYEYLRHTHGELDERGRPIVLAMPALPASTVEATRRHIVNEPSR